LISNGFPACSESLYDNAKSWRTHCRNAHESECDNARLQLDTMVNASTKKTKHWTKWILFVVLLFTVPVPFYMLVVGGIVPFFYILYLSMHGLVVAIPRFTAEGFWMLGILWAHVAILGGLLYLAAWTVCWLLFKILPNRYALSIVIGLVVVLSVASTREIYRMPGHNSSPPANITRVMKSLMN